MGSTENQNQNLKQAVQIISLVHHCFFFLAIIYWYLLYSTNSSKFWEHGNKNSAQNFDFMDLIFWEWHLVNKEENIYKEHWIIIGLWKRQKQKMKLEGTRTWMLYTCAIG